MPTGCSRPKDTIPYGYLHTCLAKVYKSLNVLTSGCDFMMCFGRLCSQVTQHSDNISGPGEQCVLSNTTVLEVKVKAPHPTHQAASWLNVEHGGVYVPKSDALEPILSQTVDAIIMVAFLLPPSLQIAPLPASVCWGRVFRKCVWSHRVLRVFVKTWFGQPCTNTSFPTICD